MKKITCLLVLLALCAGLLCACSTVGICDNCGQKEKLKDYTFTGSWGSGKGEVVHLCDDCYKLYKLMGY